MKFKKGKAILEFFFTKKRDKTPTEKIEEMLPHLMKYLPQIREMMRRINEGEIGQANSDGEIIGRMYDFYKNYGAHTGFTENAFMGAVAGGTVTVNTDGVAIPDQYSPPKDNRQVATPLSVMNELATVPVPFTLEGLDDKIATLKDKSAMINQRYAKDQIKGLLKCLENRKKYIENVEFYTRFPNTTDNNIDALLEKYKLHMDTSELFIPTFPKDAIDIMKEYTAVTKKVTGEIPVYYVIAEEKDFKKKREKLDPILLVQSPFGFYWQILGAWDKEMLLLSEL